MLYHIVKVQHLEGMWFLHLEGKKLAKQTASKQRRDSTLS
jgi:hypothetical protein